jgi:hypothetical protein
MKVKDTALDDFTIKLAEEIANATAWQLTNNAVTPEELQDAIYVVENLVSLQEQTLVQGMQFSSLDSYIDVSYTTAKPVGLSMASHTVIANLVLRYSSSCAVSC